MNGMSRRALVAILTVGSLLVPCTSSSAQQDQTETKRKVVNKVTPSYPDMARPMNLKGVVKLEAVVGTSGTVKSVRVRGGHPILVQAAESAIQKWKWEPASHETREPVEVDFDPQ
jgi:TonB family protein